MVDSLLGNEYLSPTTLTILWFYQRLSFYKNYPMLYLHHEVPLYLVHMYFLQGCNNNNNHCFRYNLSFPHYLEYPHAIILTHLPWHRGLRYKIVSDIPYCLNPPAPCLYSNDIPVHSPLLLSKLLLHHLDFHLLLPANEHTVKCHTNCSQQLVDNNC